MEKETLATILVVDDHPTLLDNLQLTLSVAGYYVLTAHDGVAALAALQAQPVDLILADIAMPVLNGYQLYERVRENPEWVFIPFLFLTARTLDSDIRYGKGLGVDDYLTKPIEPEDLLAAVQGKLRRANQLTQRKDRAQTTAKTNLPQPQASPPVLVVGKLTIDPGQHKVWLAEKDIKLSAREFILLEYLSQRVRQVISPPELIKATHNLETDMAEAGALLRPLIRSLRRKLGYRVGEMGCLENVRGVGYRLIPPQ
jgi:DNA-binding response OmpR family regulator